MDSREFEKALVKAFPKGISSEGVTITLQDGFCSLSSKAMGIAFRVADVQYTEEGFCTDGKESHDTFIIHLSASEMPLSITL